MDTQTHFDAISATYDTEIPEHIRRHLLGKKTQSLLNVLKSHGLEAGHGLDCGCGTGHYLAEMVAQGFVMSGFEYSQGMLDQATNNTQGTGSTLSLGSITEIPFDDASFDFCYTINVLHHLPNKEAQLKAVGEMLRVTRPGGLVLLQDFDADNPLVRFYMNVIFPMTSSIDDDETEIWVSAHEFAKYRFPKGRFVALDRFTFLPNFTPRGLFPIARQLERGLEALTRRRMGAHFMLAFERLA